MLMVGSGHMRRCCARCVAPGELSVGISLTYRSPYLDLGAPSAAGALSARPGCAGLRRFQGSLEPHGINRRPGSLPMSPPQDLGVLRRLSRMCNLPLHRLGCEVIRCHETCRRRECQCTSAENKGADPELAVRHTPSLA
jgi:hypothetical protein